MAFYSDELIEEVRSRNDIVDVIGGYVRLTKKGSTYFGLCPFHNEKTGSFSVSPNKQMFYCFGCGAGGNAITFLMKYENFSFKEALQVLADRAGVDLPQQEMTENQKREADKKSRLLEINKEAAKYFYSLLRGSRGSTGMEYFKGRQLSPETMQRFGLGYADQYSDDLYRYLKSKGYDDNILKESGLVRINESRGGYDYFFNRVMFPIMDIHNRVIGFGGRVMGEGEPKYLNSPDTAVFDKGRNLFGFHIAHSTKRKQIILCEGYMDVISLHQAGFDNAAASLGTAFTQGQANLLRRYAKDKDILLSYDSDEAGVKAALRNIPILREAGFATKVINMRPYKDPDEFIKNLGAEEYEKRIEEAENSFLFRVRMAQRGYDMNDPTSKSAYHSEVAGMLLEFTDELERENYLEAVSDQLGVSLDALRKKVFDLAMKGGAPVRKSMEAQEEGRTPLKSGVHEKKEDGRKKSQKLLLTWLIEDTRMFGIIQGLITPEDFTEEIYHQVATELFAQYRDQGSVNPAGIISHFEDEEEQAEVASLFNATIHALETTADREKALKDTILRVKQNSVNYASEHMDPADLNGMMRMIEERKALERIEKMNIHLD